MNRVLGLVASSPKTCARQITVPTAQIKGLEKIKKKQMLFQAPNDDPVFLKGGFSDYALFYVSLILMVGGLGGSIHSAYKLATKK